MKTKKDKKRHGNLLGIIFIFGFFLMLPALAQSSQEQLDKLSESFPTSDSGRTGIAQDAIDNLEKTYPTSSSSTTTDNQSKSTSSSGTTGDNQSTSTSTDEQSTGGLVKCGRGNDVNDRCTLCDLIVGLNDILTWGKNVMVYIALVGIFASGVMYIISAGNQKLMEQAKSYIIQIAIGISIVLGAWLFIETMMHVLSTNSDLGVGATGWSTFECENPATQSSTSSSSSSTSTSSTSSSSPTSSTSSSTQTTTPSSTTAPSSTTPTSSTSDSTSTKGDEQATRDKLADAGVKINRENACTEGQTTGCTSVGGFRDETVERIIEIKELCGENCDVTVTGGSEAHSSGQYSHENGYKADLAFSSGLDQFIETKFHQEEESAFGGFPTYTDGNGNMYVKEDDHWDVCYQCRTTYTDSDGNTQVKYEND